MATGKKDEISLKGLDAFSKSFLVGDAKAAQKTEVRINAGQNLGSAGQAKYEQELQKDFIRRAGSFTEDLVAFIMEQRQKRDLSNTETIFAIALANINLREDYGGNPEVGAAAKAESVRDQKLAEFDAICVGAQEYYDANAFST